MKKTIFSLALIGLLASCSNKDFSSPNHLLHAELDGQSLNVYYKEALVLPNVHLGLVTESANLDSDLSLKKVSKSSKVKADYQMPAGKRLHCKNSANERLLTYTNPQGEKLGVKVRLYNDGLAIRYNVPAGSKVTEDRTSYTIREGANRWISIYDAGYEQPYPHATDGLTGYDQRKHKVTKGEWGYPALTEPSKGVFALLAEADLRAGDCGSYLVNAGHPEQYNVKLVSPASFHDGETPWRCAIIGSLADVVESTLITDLAAPSEIADPSWIKPGPSSWIYWANN